MKTQHNGGYYRDLKVVSTKAWYARLWNLVKAPFTYVFLGYVEY